MPFSYVAQLPIPLDEIPNYSPRNYKVPLTYTVSRPQFVWPRFVTNVSQAPRSGEVAARSEVGFRVASKRRHYELRRFPDHLVFAYAQAENKQRENVLAMDDARARRHTRSR